MKHLVNNLLAVAVVASVFAICAQRTYGQDIVKLERFVQAKGNTASMQIFREGRDFIEAQNWQKAAEKFNDFIKGYPKDKDLDAALYWYGYALQKQDRKEEAAVPLVNPKKEKAVPFETGAGNPSAIVDIHQFHGCPLVVRMYQRRDQSYSIRMAIESVWSKGDNNPPGSALGQHFALPARFGGAGQHRQLKRRV